MLPCTRRAVVGVRCLSCSHEPSSCSDLCVRGEEGVGHGWHTTHVEVGVRCEVCCACLLCAIAGGSITVTIDYAIGAEGVVQTDVAHYET